MGRARLPRGVDDDVAGRTAARLAVGRSPPPVTRPPRLPKGGRPPADDRSCLFALIYLLREGGTWRRLPCRELQCPSATTVWRRQRDGANAGVWERLHQRLPQHWGREGALDTAYVVADSASTRALFGGPLPGPTRPTAASKA